MSDTLREDSLLVRWAQSDFDALLTAQGMEAAVRAAAEREGCSVASGCDGRREPP